MPRNGTRGLVVAGALAIALAALAAAPAPDLPRATPFDGPLARAPLDTPLVVTGGFAEYRIGHFHAGFDFGTGKRVGAPVYATLDGHVARVRTSGVGYGRSLYVRTKDGRLLQFGHLDAFAEPVASWVAAIQDSTGQYEQDLWPEASRFPVRARQRIAWTGESGAGGPHLHFEIRRGDVAYHPQRAGLRVADRARPTLATLTLDPLDDTSHVAGATAPRTITLHAAGDTITARGRLRAIVGARDGTWSGVDRMVPWLTRLEWEGGWIECRMDSISWADEMAEGDWVFDAGRVTGQKGIVLWAPAGFRPRFFHASEPLARDAGTIELRPGDPPLTLRLSARDAGGNTTTRRVVVRPDARPAARRAADAPGGAPRADGAGAGRTAVSAHPDSAASFGAGEGLTLSWPRGTFFERQVLYHAPPGALPPRGDEFDGRRAAPGVEIRPDATPLRRSLTIGWAAGREATRGLSLYRWDRDEWSLVSSRTDSARGVELADSRRLGTFALLADTLAPRITIQPAPRRPSAARAKAQAYSRWALQATIVERGSGVDARASWFEVNGKRVPAEWDPEASALRWRPRRVPAAGTYRVSVIAADRAGNRRVRSTELVVD